MGHPPGPLGPEANSHMKRGLFYIATALIPLLVLAMLLELVLPALVPVNQVLLKKWGNRPLTFWPNMAMRSLSPRHDVRFVTNSLGFNDREHSLAAAPGVKRVLLLGDSYIAALNVPPARHFARLLEQKAAAKGAKLEVIAMGISGWGQAQQLATYRTVGRPFKPDMVISFFCANDLANNTDPLYPPPVAIYTLDHDRLVYNLPPEEIPYPWTTLWANRLMRRANTYWLIKSAANRLRASFLVSDQEKQAARLAGRGQGARAYYSQRQMRLFKALVAGMHERIQVRDQHPLLGVIVSGNVFISPDAAYRELLGITRQSFARNQIPCLDLDAIFRQRFAQTGQASCHPSDAHWNEQGHRWVAELLYPRIQAVLGLP